jgi:CRISPR/Cas system-associated exonuclease Cas4 (RecB family)
MPLPINFQFSQGSLQAYVDCPRLFQLRYIERLSWPALESEPVLENERYMKLGSAFHHLVQQALVGVPEKRLETIAQQDALLLQWWNNFVTFRPNQDGYTQYPEITLSTPIGDHRLVAKYDLLVIQSSQDGARIGNQPSGGTQDSTQARIFDWKTSRKQPKRTWQADKLQTRVYPYVLVTAGADLLGGTTLAPEQIEMVYWYSNFPTNPLVYLYNQEEYSYDGETITSLIGEIKALGSQEASKTENEKRCWYCVYRSLCNRGVNAGTSDGLEEALSDSEAFDFELDLEQIAEIEF